VALLCCLSFASTLRQLFHLRMITYYYSSSALNKPLVLRLAPATPTPCRDLPWKLLIPLENNN